MKSKEQMYDSFKMLWMIAHGITIEEISILADQWKADLDYEGTFEDYIEEFGFGGEIWPCFEEFKESDLQTLDKSIL